MTYIKDPVGPAECAVQRSTLPSSSCGESSSCTHGATQPCAASSAADVLSCEPPSSAVADGLLDAIAARFQSENDDMSAAVVRLVEQRAGLVRGPTGDDARRRLQNARLKTTYPRERLTALNKQILDYRETIAKGLPSIVEAVLKLDMAQAERARTEAVLRETAAEHEHYREHDIYPETLAAISRLHEDFGISRHHFVMASDDQLRAIADILWRRRNDGGQA